VFTLEIKENSIYYIAFKGISLVSKLIRFWTRGDYSHVGVLINKDVYIEVWPESKFNAISMKWDKGSPFIKHKPKTEVTIFELEFKNKDDYLRMVNWYYSLIGKPYDWLAIIGFVLRFKLKPNNKYFCSEGAITPLVEYFSWKHINPSIVSPERFVEIADVCEAMKEVYNGRLDNLILI